MDLSIVIPAYNEETRLPKTLDSIIKYCQEQNEGKIEVIVVDDGSTDSTAKMCIDLASHHQGLIRLLTYPRNRGKGYAVKFGVLNAVGRLILINDADGATDISEAIRLEQAILKGADVAIGSRAKVSTETTIRTVWYRKIIGRIFAKLVALIILPNIADTQCGFKMFRHEVARNIFLRQKLEGFSFDVEILFLARKSGFQIEEVPINWTNISGSKVNLVRDSLRMLIDIIKIRIYSIFGGYNL